MSFLDYYKLILNKVSFDQGLVLREYHKAKLMLKKEDLKELKKWMKNSGLVKEIVGVS
jgi:hypothetical protein